ncbi:hypothetical protein D3C73_1172680 [compost metagenome]
MVRFLDEVEGGYSQAFLDELLGYPVDKLGAVFLDVEVDLLDAVHDGQLDRGVGSTGYLALLADGFCPEDRDPAWETQFFRQDLEGVAGMKRNP